VLVAAFFVRIQITIKMELLRANEILSAFNDAVKTVNSELSASKSKIQRLEGLELKIKELQSENKRLKGIERIYNLVKNHTTCLVCPQCDGKGGFEIDMGEQGCMGEECQECVGTGLVDKQRNVIEFQDKIADADF
jgi:hypothetical protein